MHCTVHLYIKGGGARYMGFLVQKDGGYHGTYQFTIDNIDQYYCTSMLYLVPPMRCTNKYIQMPLDMNLLQWNHTLICMLYGCPFYPRLCMRTVTTIVLWRA